MKFHQNYYILIGGIKIKIKVIKNEKNESILNIYTNNNNDKKKGEKSYSFNPIKDKMPITIGRNICNINLDNISVSKVHAQIDYIYLNMMNFLLLIVIVQTELIYYCKIL